MTTQEDTILVVMSVNQTSKNYIRLAVDAATRGLFGDKAHVSHFNDTLRIEDGRGVQWGNNAKEGKENRGYPNSVRACLADLRVHTIHEFFNSTGVRFRYVERHGIAGYEADVSHLLRSRDSKPEPADRYEGKSFPWIMDDLRERLAAASEAGLSDFNINDDGHLTAVGKQEY